MRGESSPLGAPSDLLGMDEKKEQDQREEHLRLLKEHNLLIRRQIKDNNNWTLILLRGMVMGLGTAIGATVILSLAIYALRPLQSIEPLKPAIERLVDTIDKLEKHRPGGGAIEEEASQLRKGTSTP